MCGIVGVFTYNAKNLKVNPIVRHLVQRMLFTETMVHMEHRGRDSSGIALLWDDKRTAVVKQPVKASTFTMDDGLWGKDMVNPEDKEANYMWLMNKWLRKYPDAHLKAALGHVRKGTQGSEYNTHNNHPIIVSSRKFGKGGEIKKDLTIGVHNGSISNDKELIKEHNLKTVGEVDSEVIFQLIHKDYRDDYTVENLEKTFRELTGAHSIMAFNPDVPNKIAGMRETRPLNAAYIPEIGTLLLASESKCLEAAYQSYERWRVREGASHYTFVDEDGNKQDLGKVHNEFPFITRKWYDTSTTDTMEAGVFVLDLDKEVDEKTSVKDLVDVKRIFSKVGSKTTTYDAYGAGYQTKPTVGKAATSTKGNASTPTTASDKPKQTVVVDHTDYSDKEPAVDLSLYSEHETAYSDDDSNTIEVELHEGEIEDGDDEEENLVLDSCPYEWDQRLAMAKDTLFSDNKAAADKLTMSRLSDEEIQLLLEKYMINTKTPQDASTILAYMYDILFPEGFAIGFGEGYETALADAEVSLETGGSMTTVDGTAREAELESSVASKEIAISMLQERLEEVSKRQKRAQKFIASMRPILRHLLLKEGVINRAGAVDKNKLNELAKGGDISAGEKTLSFIKRVAG